MTRIRWFRFSRDNELKPLAKIAKRLESFLYDENTSSGFIIDELRYDYLASRFVTKRVQVQSIQPPFGDAIEQQVVSFDTTKFRIVESGPGIELQDAPRSIIGFINQLGLACGFQVSISELDVSLEEWVDNLSLYTSEKIKCTSIECKDVVLDKNLTASISVSGTGNIQDALSSLLGSHSYILRKIKLQLGGSTVVLSRNGSANVSGGELNRTVEILRNTIP